MMKLRVPGRICLFGEHQDYLSYPVIAMAISKYIYLEAERISDRKFQIDLPNINDSLEIPLNNKELEYLSRRDYLRSGYNQFIREGIKFNKGYKIKIIGNIPINAGASSSSALVIAWLSFLNAISGNFLNKYQLANKGYDTEVKEFGEAGGKMDFFTSIYGDFIFLQPHEVKPIIIDFPIKLNGFILGNSLEKKETVEDLRRTKNLSIKAFEIVKELMPDFDKYKTSLEDIEKFLPSLKKEHQKKIIGNIINRDLTQKAKDLFLNHLDLLKTHHINSKEMMNFSIQLGDLLVQHHVQLKENIEIYTEKISKMIDDCLQSGALGAKINGSGFGGTIFAFSPEKEDSVMQAIEQAGGVAYLIKTSNGVEEY